MFELARFTRLAQAQWAEYWRTYAWFVAVAVIIHFVLLLALMSGDGGFRLFTIDGQSGFYLIGLYVTSPIFAARYFQAMGKREAAGLLLMRPASKFEKWLLAVLVVAVLYPAVYSLAFYICNAPAALYAQAAAAQADAARVAVEINGRSQLFVPREYGIYLPGGNFRSWHYVAESVLLLSSYQAFAVLGSLYFRSFPALKTIVAAFALLLFMMLVTTVAGGESQLFLSYWTVDRELVAWQQWFFPFVWFAVPGLLWLASLFALGEREVA